MNFPIKKILVPTDFSETGLLAIEHAAFLARLSKADLVLLHVLPLSEYYFEIPEPIMRVPNHDEINRVIAEKLEEVAGQVEKNYGIRPQVLSAQGQVAHEVVETAKEEKVDLIIMGTHGAKGFEELFIGSNAFKVVHIAPCPVITVQTHAKKLGFSDIVLPVDRSTHSREKVDPAIHFASLYGAKIHIVGLASEDDEEEYNKLQIVLDQVEHAVKKAGLPFSRHTVKGKNLAEEALKYGSKVNADLIITMTEQESSMGGVSLGTFARQIVNHSRIPVMSIKPHYRIAETYNIEGVNRFY